MFTGLVQSVGKVSLQGSVLKVQWHDSFASIKIGDSVAVDGVCLTVVEIDNDCKSFIADVSEETLSRTTLGPKAKSNGLVNLEPALRLKDRLGGHLVSGHVDGLGEVALVEEQKHSWKIEVSWRDSEYGRYICEKGSICLNGISLTVAKSSRNGLKFSIAVIPHTWFSTSLQYLSIGDLVNLEADLMAKYAHRLLLGEYKSENNSNFEITKSWLATQGWT